MNNQEITKRLNTTLDYLRKRKDYLYEQIQKIKHNLEEIIQEIQEQEKYIELESQKEKTESNIFNLYDTTNKYVEEKKHLAAKLAGMNVEKNQFEVLLDALQKEFEKVNENIISNQVMVRFFLEKESSDSVKEETTKKEIEIAEKKKDGDIISRIKFCKDILQLDKERCLIELQNLIYELEKENIVE